MIVTPLTDGQNPGKSSDKQYVKATRNYDNQVKGEPYITAEFANGQPFTSFPVGDGKYYPRDSVTEAKRKRRETSCESVHTKWRSIHCLRTFTLIVSAHPYCEIASNLRHVMDECPR